MKSIWLTALFLTLSAPLTYADLRYTTRADIRTKDDASGIGTALQTLMPFRETRTFIRADAVRMEIMPTDHGDRPRVILLRGGHATVLDANTQTYWNMPWPLADVTATQASRKMFQWTGEFETLIGYRAEQITYRTSLTLPFTPPPGFPATFAIEGELWIADAYHAYSKAVGDALGMATGSAGLENLAGAGLPQGIVLRHVVRNAQYGYELVYTVTELSEETVDAALVEVPVGYRQVAAPPLAAQLGPR